MGPQDILRRGFLEQFAVQGQETLNVWSLLISFGMALLMGVFIFYIYKYSFGGVMYSRSFNVALIGLTLVSTFVLLAVTTHVILALGMVGALSIVRFRTAIKDPMDLVFLFWAIGTGIVVGAQLFTLAVIGSLIIGALLIVTSRRMVIDTPYLVIINCENQAIESECLKIIESSAKRARLKSKVVSAGKGTEFIYEIRSKGDKTGFIDEISNLEGVNNASLVSYNGEFLD
jgi:uncharacterized membrane protein YhiD involved in acid resistance